ncbi:hypothetical protein EVAR_31610_1 [Eumeta japonica]|uniref:Uncharacterized protein n=1 Tax=Eumeta variegata TaxID=151549 RepID=A0A4C1VY15_EUMVA|nr:hypothetical protein EVAR_31610_1 [Eumeta japonica]
MSVSKRHVKIVSCANIQSLPTLLGNRRLKMESRVGLDYIVEHAEYAGKLAAALATPAPPVKKQSYAVVNLVISQNWAGFIGEIPYTQRIQT